MTSRTIDELDALARSERELEIRKDQESDEVVAAIRERKRLRDLLETEAGRHFVRLRLAEGGLFVGSDKVESILTRHHGEMCHDESDRIGALRLFWAIARMLATDELPLGLYRTLMTETDSDN